MSRVHRSNLKIVILNSCFVTDMPKKNAGADKKGNKKGGDKAAKNEDVEQSKVYLNLGLP